MNILVYTRPALTAFLASIFEKSKLRTANKYYITEYHKEAQMLNNCELISPNKLEMHSTQWAIFSDDELFDIICRDRYLAKIPFDAALQLIKNVTHQISLAIIKARPDLMTGHIVDYYTMDIFYRMAKKMNIPCYFMVTGIKGTIKFYDYRWPIKRSVPNLSINLFDYMGKREINLYRKQNTETIIYRMRKLFYLKRRQLMMYNYFNPDVRSGNVDVIILRKGYQALQKFTFMDFLKDYFVDLDKINFDNKKRIYVSLHFYPEATMNYFSEDNSLIKHDDLVLEILHKFHFKYNFIIKEHPVMMGRRDLSFYKTIRQIPNCYLIRPETDTYGIVEASDVVLSWAGSIGWEAPFLGKKTINIMKPYYFVEGVNNYFTDYKDLMDNFIERVESLNYDNSLYCEKLNECFQSFSYPGISIPTYNSDENINNLAASVDQLVFDVFNL